MEAIKKKKNEKIIAKSVTQNKVMDQKPKSKFTLFREKYPNGVGEIIDMRAVLR
jgi:hypothetical protein